MLSCVFLLQGLQADVMRLEQELRVLDTEVGRSTGREDTGTKSVSTTSWLESFVFVGGGGEDKLLQAGLRGS